MSSIQFHPNELLLIYNDPNTTTGKQTRAYAKSVSNNVNEVNISNNNFTTTLWKEVINMLNLHPLEIMDRSCADYKAKIEGNNFTMTGMLEVLAHNPTLLKAPIAVYQNNAVFCLKPTDILKFENSSTSKVPPHLRRQ
ncbi:arsenate reductase family protein [Fulvivirga lutimaris]|uniref:arsenate reductase family protein n=1 Tax=Fulvivirga lutimaris TaxID=1819566 RepID=UPI0012BC7B01|nr:glutaredoxin [Fulvivirga lutimaris]MTI40114.1 glutaredoxin [Fulvivirga lutimaris]